MLNQILLFCVHFYPFAYGACIPSSWYWGNASPYRQLRPSLPAEFAPSCIHVSQRGESLDQYCAGISVQIWCCHINIILFVESTEIICKCWTCFLNLQNWPTYFTSLGKQAAQNFSPLLAESQAFSIRGSESQVFSIRGSESQAFSIRGSESQAFSIRGSESQAFSIRGSESQAFSIRGSAASQL